MLLADIQSLTSHLAPPKVPQGLQPPALNESVHTVRCLQQLRSKDKSLEKYIYLTQLKDADERMFYKICLTNMSVSCRDNFLGHKRSNYLIFPNGRKSRLSSTHPRLETLAYSSLRSTEDRKVWYVYPGVDDSSDVTHNCLNSISPTRTRAILARYFATGPVWMRLALPSSLMVGFEPCHSRFTVQDDF